MKPSELDQSSYDQDFDGWQSLRGGCVDVDLQLKQLEEKQEYGKSAGF